ncbi:MaoC/PaaZ C-terminal domain-containing protein [Pseudarthrobacter sp. lyk4-40-TYG-27]|uniref:MaoC/PaaZ C-terminal domain-containing protein n=1 Tax=Pseudarthrobacter sp. lyk4-40-TYG-27 TaxID=3040305 RepID=UPI0025566CA1|nr:MaoC/PaaZ C-terminal domain-containing protein [Pseudarthrobacter sp. lyk4-40-TYG-27]
MVGEELPEFRRRSGLETWNRYAAVNDEFVPIHMDDAAGRAAGMPGAIGMGNLQVAYMHNLLRGWLGDRGRIVQVTASFRQPNIAGDIVVAGTVTAVRRGPGEVLADIDLAVRTPDGEVLAPGSATVAFTAG